MISLREDERKECRLPESVRNPVKKIKLTIRRNASIISFILPEYQTGTRNLFPGSGS
jgi:hypothetical protein